MFPSTALRIAERLRALGLIESDKSLAVRIGRAHCWFSNLRCQPPALVADRATLRLWRLLQQIKEAAAPRLRPEMAALLEEIERDRRVIEWMSR